MEMLAAALGTKYCTSYSAVTLWGNIEAFSPTSCQYWPGKPPTWHNYYFPLVFYDIWGECFLVQLNKL